MPGQWQQYLAMFPDAIVQYVHKLQQDEQSGEETKTVTLNYHDIADEEDYDCRTATFTTETFEYFRTYGKWLVLVDVTGQRYSCRGPPPGKRVIFWESLVDRHTYDVREMLHVGECGLMEWLDIMIDKDSPEPDKGLQQLVSPALDEHLKIVKLRHYYNDDSGRHTDRNVLFTRELFTFVFETATVLLYSRLVDVTPGLRPKWHIGDFDELIDGHEYDEQGGRMLDGRYFNPFERHREVSQLGDSSDAAFQAGVVWRDKRKHSFAKEVWQDYLLLFPGEVIELVSRLERKDGPESKTIRLRIYGPNNSQQYTSSDQTFTREQFDDFRRSRRWHVLADVADGKRAIFYEDLIDGHEYDVVEGNRIKPWMDADYSSRREGLSYTAHAADTGDAVVR
ncbi:hypothetical protein WJX73_008003 [Symbiochloris irregularis]|uniref:Uncharacterized protein n=1 Tax=Symbiochloris irregularis TaxID=706552 RepID=A0AAW1NSW0_9CHLO